MESETNIDLEKGRELNEWWEAGGSGSKKA